MNHFTIQQNTTLQIYYTSIFKILIKKINMLLVKTITKEKSI